LKKIATLGLLALLLYNMLGLSTAVLLFEKDYQLATGADESGEWITTKLYLPSLPYTNSPTISENLTGLIRNEGDFYNATRIVHTNDTLYVTLKTNQAARDRFFDLAAAMQVTSGQDAGVPENSNGKIIKLLSNLIKTYIPDHSSFHIPVQQLLTRQLILPYGYHEMVHNSFEALLSTPPPELG
jgi:hypothetical protein